jgi:hypothetical protein
MKIKVFLGIALLSVVSLSACASSRKVKTKSAPAQIVVSQEDEEIKKAERELKLMEIEAKKKKLETQIALDETIISGNHVVISFCSEFAIDKPGEYMAGLGISRPKKFEQEAKLEANTAAISDITSRFMGVIRTGSNYYSKATTLPGGKDMDESEMEMMTMNVVEKSINKYARQVCFKIVQDNDGLFKGYIALHVDEKEVVDEVAIELEKKQLVKDKEEFKQEIFNQLDRDAKKRVEEQERKLQMVEE